MYFVYYSDDYYEMGGVGLERFDTQDKALGFILDRMKSKGHSADLDDYLLICGEEQSVVATEKVVALKVE